MICNRGIRKILPIRDGRLIGEQKQNDNMNRYLLKKEKQSGEKEEIYGQVCNHKKTYGVTCNHTSCPRGLNHLIEWEDNWSSCSYVRSVYWKPLKKEKRNMDDMTEDEQQSLRESLKEAKREPSKLWKEKQT